MKQIVLKDLPQALMAHAVLIALCVVYSLSVYVFASHIGLAHRFTVFSSSSSIISILLAGIICIALAQWLKATRIDQPEARIPHLVEFIKKHLRLDGGVFTFALPLILISVLVAAFTTFKGIYSTAQPFHWDESFAHWDRLLHFGVDPWKITHALFGADLASFAINWAYNMWFGFMWISICCALLLTGNMRLRSQYILSFCLCWVIIGSLGAIAFSSAGPVYFAEVTGDPTPFGALTERLHAIDARLDADYGLSLLALDIQDILWRVYSSNGELFGGGISAMPSMHVSIATLMALGAWQINRKLGIAFMVYAVIIQIGSVHLAWHYAIDGYVSIIATLCIWKATGFALSRANTPETALAAA